jgi:DNA polymerase/3'-5' exonuclease PolX
VKGIGKGIVSKINEFIENQDPDYYVSDDEEYESDDESLVSDDEEKFQSPNKDIYDMLIEYADNEPNRHKALIYERAADGVHDLTYRVTNGAALADGPQKVFGVGKKCAQLIDTYLKCTHKNNDKLAKCFLKLSNSANNEFKASAYENAADKLLKLNRTVTCGKDVKNLKGFGKSICSKIDEYVAAGKC